MKRYSHRYKYREIPQREKTMNNVLNTIDKHIKAGLSVGWDREYYNFLYINIYKNPKDIIIPEKTFKYLKKYGNIKDIKKDKNSMTIIINTFPKFFLNTNN